MKTKKKKPLTKWELNWNKYIIYNFKIKQI